jgi:hypothetical protein
MQKTVIKSRIYTAKKCESADFKKRFNPVQYCVLIRRYFSTKRLLIAHQNKIL